MRVMIQMSQNDFCQYCLTKKFCLWDGLIPSDHRRLLDITKQHGLIHHGHSLFRRGESLRSLYILRSASVKTWYLTEDGESLIVRFYLPGDVLGLGAISSGKHDSNATTLDTCSVCELPFQRFQRLAEDIPALNFQLLKWMSREIALEEQRVLLRSNRSAPARLATFLDCLSRNLGDRGFSSREFNLTMGRRDIASYLGLAMETVSRTLSQFQDQGVLQVEGKRIVVMDKQRLLELSGLSADIHDSGRMRSPCL